MNLLHYEKAVIEHWMFLPTHLPSQYLFFKWKYFLLQRSLKHFIPVKYWIMWMAVYITDKYLIHQAVLHTECHTTSWELLGLPEYLLLKASACISYVTGWQWSSVNRGESILTVFHLVQVLIQSGVKGTLSSRWRTLSLILYTSTYGILDNRGPVYA